MGVLGVWVIAAAIVAAPTRTPREPSSTKLSPEAVSAFAEAFARGCDAFDAFALPDAERWFDRAAALATTGPETARALLWLGAVRAESGDFTTARARLAAAVAADAAVAVPPQLSPTIHQIVDELRVAARKPAGGADAPPIRWVLWAGGAVAALGAAAVGGAAFVGLGALAEREVAAGLAFQSDASAAYGRARDGALWANVLYGAGGVLIATGGGLAVASALGADEP